MFPTQEEIEVAAQKAARTGDVKDLHDYLELRYQRYHSYEIAQRLQRERWADYS